MPPRGPSPLWRSRPLRCAALCNHHHQLGALWCQLGVFRRAVLAAPWGTRLGRWGRGAGPGFKRYVRACWRVRRGHVQRQRARVICHRTAGSLLSHPGWLGFCRGRALTDGAPVTHCWGPPNRQVGAYGLKPGFWMAGARGRVLARAFACWACCAPPFEGSAWEHVAAAFCPGHGFLGGACDGNVASAAPGRLGVCGCGVWTACLYLAGDLWSRQPCDAASVTFFIHAGPCDAVAGGVATSLFGARLREFCALGLAPWAPHVPPDHPLMRWDAALGRLVVHLS